MGPSPQEKNHPIHNWTEVKAFLYYQAVNKTFIAVMLVILFQQSVGSYLFINSFIYLFIIIIIYYHIFYSWIKYIPYEIQR